MKKRVSTLFIISLLVVACGGGSDSSSGTNSIDEALVGVWGLTSINGMAISGNAEVGFSSDGSFATDGWDELGMCDDSGDWATADGVLTLSIGAVSPAGTDCEEVGSEEKFSYSVDSATLTAKELVEGDVAVFTKM